MATIYLGTVSCSLVCTTLRNLNNDIVCVCSEQGLTDSIQHISNFPEVSD